MFGLPVLRLGCAARALPSQPVAAAQQRSQQQQKQKQKRQQWQHNLCRTVTTIVRVRYRKTAISDVFACYLQ
jgi:hypothetical protein